MSHCNHSHTKLSSLPHKVLSNVFRLKGCSSYDLKTCVVHKFQRGKCNASYCGEIDRQKKVMSRQHIGISSLTFKKIRLSAVSWERDRGPPVL